jgi:hypothetical protein
MNYPRLLMTASALFLAALGLPCMFAPDVVLTRLGDIPSMPVQLLVQLTGGLYLGFAMLNWMGKGSLMGGIYGRPVAMGNMLHFVVGAFALTRTASSMPRPDLAWLLAALYVIFGAGFAFVIFRNPLAATAEKSS